MSDAQALIAALRSGREKWIDVEPGKAVKIRRPAEAEFPQFLRKTDAGRGISVELEQVQRYVVDWRGITEADLLGETVGSKDALPFDAAVWAEVVADRVEWLGKTAQALIDSIVQHLAEKAQASGNSSATSTPGQPAIEVAPQTSSVSTTTS